MKTTIKIRVKNYLTFGSLFIAFLSFGQTINFIQTSLTIDSEDTILTVNVEGETKCTWSFSVPVDAYINNPPTVLYTNQQVSTLYLKPNLSQLDSESFIITAASTWSNLPPVSQNIIVKNNVKICRASLSTEWNNPNNWKPYGVPTASSSVIIPEKTFISGNKYNAFAKNIVVKANGILEIQSGNSLTVTDWINVNTGGAFIVRNNASIIQTSDLANTGNVTIEKITAPMCYYDYTYWNSPITAASNFTIGSLSPGTSTDLWSYTPTIAGGSGNWTNISPSTVMIPTKGYIVKAPDTFSSNPTAKTTFTTTFIGTPNNGPISVPIVKGTNANIGGFVKDSDDEWNLIGNPYPSAIDINKFLESPENLQVIEGTIYIWTQIPQPTATSIDSFYGDYVLNYTSNDYASYNKTGATGTASSSTNKTATPTALIPSGKSFFVKAASTMANGTTSKVTFNNSMRVSNEDVYISNTNLKTTIPEEKNRIWLNLTNNSGAFSQTLIGYVTNATQGLDKEFDGKSFGGNDVTFYSIIPEANLSIQGRSLPFDPNDKVTLGYNAAKKGNYSIRIDHLDGLFDTQNIYLEDKDLNIIHDLKLSPYVFNTKVGNYNNRFSISYGGKTLAVNKNNINNEIKVSYIKNSNALIINNNLTDVSVEKITLYNTLAQVISTYKIEYQEQQNIICPIKNLSSGAYIAKIKTSNGDFSKKFIINN